MPGMTVSQLVLNIAVNSQQGQQGLSQFQASLKNLGLTTQQTNAIMQQFGGKGQQLVSAVKQLGVDTKQTEASLKAMGLTTQQANTVMQQWGTTSQQTNAIMQQLGITTPQLTKSLKDMGLTSQQANGVMQQLGVATKQTGEEYNQLTNYVKRAAIAFAAFKALDIMRDFVTGTVEAAKNAENFGNALRAALPEGVSFSQTMKDMGETTRGLIPEWEQMRMATQLYASGLASTSEEAAKLANAGVILTTVFRGQNATWDKYFRLLQGGTKQLYDNFNLSKLQIDALTDQIQATTGLSTEEAKLQAIRQVVIAQGEKFKDSLGDLTSATMTAQAAWQDYMALVGTGAKDAIIGANSVITKLIIGLIGQKKASDEAAIGAYKMGMSYKDWTEAAHAAGVDIRGLTEDLYAQAQASKAGQEPLDLWMRLMAAQAEVTQGAAEANRIWVASHGNMLGSISLGIQLLPTYLAEWESMYGDKSKIEERALKASQDAANKEGEARYNLVMSIAGYFGDLRSMQDDYKRSMGDLASSSWDAANEADDKRLDYTASFNEKIGGLEQDRADKIKWVRDGAWNRTQQEEADAELWWNNIYDQKERDQKASYDRQMKDATEAEEKRQAELGKQQAAEKKAYDDNLQHLKLVAALTVVEMSGQLQSLTGGMVKTAEDAAKLIEARYLKPSDALLAAIAGASKGIQDLNAGVSKDIEDSTPAWVDALTGKFGAPVTILNNAMAKIPSTFDDMAKLVADSAVMAGGAVDGLTGRTTEATTGVEGIGTAWSDLLKKASPNIMNLKKRIQNDLLDKLAATTTETSNVATGISGTWTDTKDDTSKLVARFAEMEQGLKNVEKAAGGAGGAISNMGTAVPVTQANIPPVTVTPVHTYPTGQGRAKGGAFIVPPGYNKDNFPVFVSSGEHVTVIPKDKVVKFAGGTGDPPWYHGVAPEIVQMRLASIQGEVFKKIERMVKENATTFADYFKELRDLQQRAIDDEKAFNETIAGIRKDAKAEEKDRAKDYNKDITDLEKKRHDEIAALDADAWGITNEEYTVALAAINANYDEKKKTIVDAYKEQVAAIVQGEAEKLAEEQAAYAKSREEYVDNLKRLKLIAALSVLETSGVLQEYTHGWAKTADEAATLIESGLLPISKEFATAIGTAMQGMTNSTVQANKVLAQNKKTIAGLTGMTYAPNAQVGAMLPQYPNTPIGALMSGVGTSIAQYTGDWQSFIKFFSGLNIDAILAGMRGGGGHKDKILREALAPYYNIPTNRTVFGQHGLDMIVPPGYARDNFPVYVSSGERVTVTPPGMSRTNQINITGNWNPQTEGDLMRYVRIANLMR